MKYTQSALPTNDSWTSLNVMGKMMFLIILALLFLYVQPIKTNAADDTNANEQLIQQYVQSKGSDIIVFDTSNIKQYWIDNSVESQDDSFTIQLKEGAKQGYDNLPLRIQLANVRESQDCKVEVISETADLEFSALNDKQKEISVSSQERKLVNCSVISSVFHLEDTPKNIFFLKFASKNSQVLSIKRIILSFSHNPNSTFLDSPVSLKLSKEILSPLNSKMIDVDGNISVTGKNTVIFVNKKFILSSNNTIHSSVKIKNTGETPTQIYIGYKMFSKDSTPLDARNYPYNDTNKLLKVISSEDNSNTIIVDSMPEWAKGCFIAMNAEEDLSDIPNMTLSEGRIQEVRELSDGHAEITMDKPFKKALPQNTAIRIHGRGNNYLYTNNKVLNSDQEEVFSYTISKDENGLFYTSKTFPKGVYCVQPVILSYSKASDKENTILISEFDFSF